ncbi:unnamed protein product [Dibothriocephalus latus]|uniref:Uncharacterized protein n=1 Tax=Dibothriocephalus latus TaxID=60516 RepID=A0A3P7NW86_DIBLA|nr:unnamed protein product [Dibothriocephalus latus]
MDSVMRVVGVVTCYCDWGTCMQVIFAEGVITIIIIIIEVVLPRSPRVGGARGGGGGLDIWHPGSTSRLRLLRQKRLAGILFVGPLLAPTKVPELYLSSSTIFTEPEPSQHTSSTISTPSSPELPRACRSNLPSPRWSLSLELSPTGKPRKLTLGVAESDSKPNHSRRTQSSQDLKLRRVKSRPCGQRPSVVRIRRNQSEGCIAWQPCASTRSNRKDDGTVLNDSAQASQSSLVISTTRSCLAPVSCSTVTTKVVEAVSTGTVINDAFSLGRTDDEAVPTTKTTETSRIALLTLRRKALVDELSRLHLELLHSLRAEWQAHSFAIHSPSLSIEDNISPSNNLCVLE